MPGRLFIVATPIGNLEDITHRAVRVLREVATIASEDTRRTAKLLARYGISTPTVSFHRHSRPEKALNLVERLAAGTNIALVSDAGTPGISDPGAELVRECVDRQIPVEPVPGVSAPLAAAVGSGFPLVPLTVYGFAPNRSGERKKWLGELSAVPWTLTFFEAPHRIRATLLEVGLILVNRQIVVARELTKIHEQFLRGTPELLVSQLENPRGEFTVVVGPTVRSTSDAAQDVSDNQLADEFGLVIELPGLSRRSAISAVARKFGVSSRVVYSAVERRRQLA